MQYFKHCGNSCTKKAIKSEANLVMKPKKSNYIPPYAVIKHLPISGMFKKALMHTVTMYVKREATIKTALKLAASFFILDLLEAL